MNSTVRRVVAVARVTSLEILRDKVLYNVLVLTLMLFGLSWFASRLTVNHPERVILDFGIAAVTLSSVLIATLNGSSMLGNEFDRRTILMVFARPVSKFEFLLGKFSGLCSVLAFNAALLSGILFLFFYFALADTRGVILSTLLVGVGFSLLQSVLLAALALFLSSFLTTSLSVIGTFCLYLIGHNLSALRAVGMEMNEEIWRRIFEYGTYLLPNFEAFDLGTKITYSVPVNLSFVGWGIAYTAILVTAFLLISSVFIRVRGDENP